MPVWLRGLKRQVWKQGVAGSIPSGDNSFWIFCLLPIPDRSVKPIQMKSSMTFIQIKGCIGIDLMFKLIWQQYFSLFKDEYILSLKIPFHKDNKD